ncbi:MAG: sugar ABC transporter ATP-binding protein, partial [Oscillochloris sp.]|nr:sugar ABC transporter ATP-binding protein [Oscillochloris sp.]
MEPILQCISLSKRFGTLGALERVSFSVAPGEVVGLVGRSGAGKSVLAGLLAGLLVPSDGEALIDGRRLRWPFRAPQHGVAVVPQRPALAERLDITANIFLGSEIGWPQRLGWLRFPDRRRMDQRAYEMLDTLDLPVETLRVTVDQLSSEQRQLVAIARAMAVPARLVVLDEP